MLNDVLAWIEQILNFGMHWPDLGSVVVGTIAGYFLTIALEAFFLPTVSDPELQRRQKGYTFLFCWLVSSLASCMFWWAIDADDKWSVRVTVCAIVTAPSFFVYPALARYLTVKFPSIGTAWKQP